MATYDPTKMLPLTRGTGPLNLPSLIGAPKPMPGLPGATPGAVPIGSPGGPGSLPQPLLDQTASNLSGALKGELPPDVVNMLQTQAAERGIGGGFAGSQAAEYGGLRTLGLTSLDRMKEAEGLLAGQFASPKDALGFEQARLEREAADRRFQQQLQQTSKEHQDTLALQKQQEANRAAEQANALAQRKMEFDLQALGSKYGGYGPTGYTPPGQRYSFDWAQGKGVYT